LSKLTCTTFAGSASATLSRHDREPGSHIAIVSTLRGEFVDHWKKID